MKKIILIVLFILMQGMPYAQNLIPNPSFEVYSECPYLNGQLPYAVPWFTDYFHFGPFGINGSSSEYFNLCDPTTGGTFSMYLFQLPRTGNGMTAFVFFGSPIPTQEYREYIEVKLTETLSANKTYCISYYANLSGYSALAIDGLCSCFTNDSLLYHEGQSAIYPCPDLACNATGNIIKDTLNWTKVSMNYLAQGGEQYITIGNFKLSSQTNYFYTNYPIGLSTYYYIDDVAVYECDTPEYPANIPDKTPCKGETVTLGSPTRAQYLYEWKDAAGNIISTEGAITFVADTPTYYVLKQKDFKFDETTDTCFITVDVLCLNIPNVITPNNDGINDLFEVSQNPALRIDLQVFNRWGKRVFYSAHYQNNWPVTDIADGVYFYILKATNPTGEVREYQGSVSVVR